MSAWAGGRQTLRPGLGATASSQRIISTSKPTRFPDHSIQISPVSSLVLSYLNIYISGLFFFQLPLISLFYSLSFSRSVNINVSLGSFSVAPCHPAPFSHCLWQFGSFFPPVCPPRNSQFHKPLQTCGSRRHHVTRQANMSEFKWSRWVVGLWGGNHGLDPPELPAGWWKDTMYSTPNPYSPNFLGPVQLAVSKGTVKG